MTTTASSPGWDRKTTSSRHSHPISPTSTPSTMAAPSFTSTAVRTPHARTPRVSQTREESPNYFGLKMDSPRDGYHSSIGQHTRGNWSPLTSHVRSTAAASPSIIPLDQRSEFDAFRKQSEANQKNMSAFDFGIHPAKTRKSQYPSPDSPKSPRLKTSRSPKVEADVGSNGEQETSQKQRSPKRMLSSPTAGITDRPRRNSPASFTDGERPEKSMPALFLHEDRESRMSLPPTKPEPKSEPSFSSRTFSRADTLPATLDPEGPEEGPPQGPHLASAQHVVNLIDSAGEEILLLDLRVHTQYARSRITGALNLCVPTMMIKRPSYTVAKLADTFKDGDQRRKFERWRSSKYIVLYDLNSSQLKDATSCVNTLKKFVSEGWTGTSYILRGGFVEFAKNFSRYVDNGVPTGTASPMSPPLNVSATKSSVPPVIGGCPMPNTKSAANPFFGNIRQNMDLIGGVGRQPIARPNNITKQAEADMPSWLQKAVDEKDEGKTVSEKFLKIEKKEQKRMQKALQCNVTYGSPNPDDCNDGLQLAGIEKGSKNRYNNIWPYEHTRVKLQGVPHGSCDYINANHVKSSRSHKHYIATQGPIPATFNDFWNVVWQQDVRVIVMLTAEKEGNQIKAHNYWDGKHYGPLHLNYLSEHRASLDLSKIHRHRDRPIPNRNRSITNPLPSTPPSAQRLVTPKMDSGVAVTPGSVSSPANPDPNSQPYVIVRKFILSHTQSPWEPMREITQLQYTNWPDFGAPAHPAHLLGLVEQCDAVVRSTEFHGNASPGPAPPGARPILVHCSAGCGRTGTFCTVDSVIDMLRRQMQLQKAKTKQAQRSPQRGSRQKTPGAMDIDSDNGPIPNPFFGSQESEANSTAGKDVKPDGDWTKKDDEDLIEKTVEDFRLQRLSMVQSLKQFALCYETVLEWLIEHAPKSA